MRTRHAVLPVAVALVAGVGADAAWARTMRVVEARVSAEVTSWGDDCGPRPLDENPATNTTYTEGADATLTPSNGAPRLFDPTICAHVTQQRDLRVDRQPEAYICQTPPGAPKGVTARITRKATGPGTLRIEHDLRYDWTLKGSHCSVSLRGRYELEDPAARPPLPLASAAPACAAPGVPATLEPIGSLRRVLPVEGRIRLAVRALDAAGCVVAGLSSWRATLGRISPEGELDARGLAAGTTVTVTASRDDLHVDFSLEIAASAADYTALTVAAPELALGQLPSLPPQRGEALSGAAEGSTDSGAPARARFLIAAFVSLLVVAALAGLTIAVRAARARARTRNRSARVLDDHALSVLARSAEAQASRKAASTERVCPKCGARYPRDVTFCGEDGERLEGFN